MNRLGFADFHAKHFSQEQQNYWSSILHQQQLLAVQGQSLQEINGNHPEQEYDLYPSYNGNNSYSEQYCNNEVAYDEQEIEAAEGLEVQEDYHFSKEAMAIFEFSENYRKERMYSKYVFVSN
ncbi:hypothetical protein BY458DRAFT_515648 [Sporodiniella umbellata]|nr:hypothetical protein BY458DRAFT_515648 [Sporodiniella umbellata]